MATKQAPLRSKIGLKGSTKICTEFFNFSVNNILFQRAIYPPEDFKFVKKYDLQLLVSADDEIKEYLDNIMKQLTKWLLAGSINQVVLAINGKESGNTLERWQFDIQPSDVGKPPDSSNQLNQESGTEGFQDAALVENGLRYQSTGVKEMKKKNKTEQEVNNEIQAIMRQITASVTFLPMIDEPCTFKILAYVDSDAQTPVPEEWIDSDPHLITGENAERVKLRSFDTSVHRVEAMIAYRVGDD